MGDFLANVGGFFNMIGGLFVPGGEENVDGSMRPRVPRLDVVIHADVLQGRGLLPRDLSGHPENWSVDPLVQVQVMVQDGEGTPHHTAGSRTGARVQTLRPVWDEELLLADIPGADAVRFSVYDDAASGEADCLGYVDVPLPPRPGPLRRGAKGKDEELPYKHGWFALTATSEQWAKLWPVVSKCGRSDRDPEPLGALHIRITWGLGVPNPVVSHRPPLRKRLAHLVLRVHTCTAVPHTKRPGVIARLEHQVGVTPEQPLTEGREWPEEEASFVFIVTEITADLILSVVRVEHTMERSKTIGEVIIPVASLLGRKGRPTWATILPAREPGEVLLRPRRKPKQPLGRLCFTAALELDGYSAPFAYMGEDVPLPERPPGKDTSDKFSPDRLHDSLGRVLDCVIGCMFAPLRTLLFLQAWLSPALNVVLLSLLLLLTHPNCWSTTLVCLPLWVLLFPLLNGFVSTLIHANDPVPLYKEDVEAHRRARHEAEKYEEQRHAMFTDARNRELEKVEKHDPSLAQHRLAHKPARQALSHLQSMLGDAAHKAIEEADHMNVVKNVMTKLAELHSKMLVNAAQLESVIALFTWTDRRLTFMVFLHVLGLGLALSFIHGVFMFAAQTLTWSTCTMLTGFCCFMPFGVPITRSIIVSIDDALLPLHSVSSINPLLSGALLRTKAPPSEELTGKELQAVVDAEARKFVEHKEAERLHALKERGLVHPRYLELSRLLSGGYFERLLQRAPNVPRQEHIRMCAAAQR